MITLERMADLVAGCVYRDWDFEMRVNPGYEDASLRVAFKDGAEEWHGRWWRLSRHMTEAEVVQTCFLAVMTAEEHEIRERFKYNGRAIFGPHLSLQALYGRAVEVEEREAPV